MRAKNCLKKTVQLFYHYTDFLTSLKKKASENIVGKGENGEDHYCLLYLHFQLIPLQFSSHVYLV